MPIEGDECYGMLVGFGNGAREDGEEEQKAVTLTKPRYTIRKERARIRGKHVSRQRWEMRSYNEKGVVVVGLM